MLPVVMFIGAPLLTLKVSALAWRLQQTERYDEVAFTRSYEKP